MTTGISKIKAPSRIERDFLGEKAVPSAALYGIQTLRCVENFRISGRPLSAYPQFIRALAAVKMAAAGANEELGLLEGGLAGAIRAACAELMEGRHGEHFPVDMVQGGAGTSINMNANEVIANRALELMGRKRGEYSAPNPANPEGSVLYRSGMNAKIHRNFEVFSPCDFIAAITQHIPDKSFQLVRYYGWYSNKMRGQRDKRAAEKAKAAGNAVAVIDVSAHKPRRIPSAKWRELIKKVWEVDPLLCPRCSHEMRIVALLDDRAVIERILRHLGLWLALRSFREVGEQGVRVSPARAPPEIVDRVIEPWPDDTFPDYDTEPVMAYANS